MEQRKAIDMATKNHSERHLTVKIFQTRALELTAIDMRQMEHSEEWVDALSASFFGTDFPKLRSLLCVVTLSRR